MGFLKVSTPLILAAILLSSLAQAAPAPRRLKARDYVTEVVTETVWTTVDITTTIYVDELPSTSVPATASAEVTSSAEETYAEESSSAENIESMPLSTVTPAASTTVAPEPATPAPAVSEPVAASELSTPAGEFVETSAPPPPVYTPPPSTSASAPEPVYTPAAAPEPPPVPAPVPAPAAIVEEVSVSSTASETASCEDGTVCKGDITWYEGGLGACGQSVDTEADNAIALPFGFMGTLSNSNPYCGMSVTVKNPVTGTTVQGTVRDKCMGCVGRAIDLTSKMFQAVTDGKGDGRVHNIEWWFN